MTSALIDHTGYLLRLAYDHAHTDRHGETMPDGPHPRDFSLLVALHERRARSPSSSSPRRCA